MEVEAFDVHYHNMKNFVDISSFSTISHFHVYGDFVLELNFWTISLLYYILNTLFSVPFQSKWYQKCQRNACVLWANSNYVLATFTTMHIINYGNDRGHAIWEASISNV